MARTKGSRNHDFDERRRALARAATLHLATADGGRAGARELARALGESPSVLQHYFGGHVALVEASLMQARQDAEHYLEHARDPGDRPLSESVTAFLTEWLQGWQRGLGLLVTGGLSHGLGHESLGPVYVNEVLEPTLQALERRLEIHRARGELREGVDLRHAALTLFAPVFVALLHQAPLGGSQCRPLDLEAALPGLVSLFVHGVGV